MCEGSLRLHFQLILLAYKILKFGEPEYLAGLFITSYQNLPWIFLVVMIYFAFTNPKLLESILLLSYFPALDCSTSYQLK